MKKYLVVVAALLFFSGISNAQVAQKQAAKTGTARQSATARATTINSKAAASTASVTPLAKKTAGGAATIKRKHFHKKTKTAAKAAAK